MRKLLAILLLMAGFAGLSLPARAALVGYSNVADFLDAIKVDYYLETFSTLADYPGLSVTFGPVNGFGFTASSPEEIFGFDVSGDRALSNGASADPIDFVFSGLAVSAIGGRFFPTDPNGDFRSGRITLNFSDGSTWSSLTASQLAFIGFTSSVPITSFSIAAGQGTCGTIAGGAPIACYPTVDDLYIGAAPVPATVALLGLGLIGLVSARRRIALIV